MNRFLSVRNALSVVLFIVAVVGISVQLRLVRAGLIGPETRLVLVGYFLVAIYAVATIVLRARSAGKRDR